MKNATFVSSITVLDNNNEFFIKIKRLNQKWEVWIHIEIFASKRTVSNEI